MSMTDVRRSKGDVVYSAMLVGRGVAISLSLTSIYCHFIDAQTFEFRSNINKIERGILKVILSTYLVWKRNLN